MDDPEIQRQITEALQSLGRAAQPLLSSLVGNAQASTLVSSEITKLRDAISKDEARRVAAQARANDPRLSTADRDRARREADALSDQIDSQKNQINASSQKLNQVLATSFLNAINRFSLGIDPFNDALDGMRNLRNVGGGFVDKMLDIGNSMSSSVKKSFISEGLGFLGKAGAKVGDVLVDSGEALDFFIDQLRAHADAFNSVTRSGIILGGGLTELAEQANQAGLGNIKQMAIALDGAREHIQNIGLAGGDAADKISKTMGNMVRGTERFFTRLTALGFDVRAQGELIALNMAITRTAGAEYANRTRDTARETFELGKNMRLLQEITGRDAKAALERARQEANRARVLSTLQGAQVESYISATATGSKTLNQALTEVLGPAGRIVSTNLNLFASAVPEFGAEVERIAEMVRKGVNPDEIIRQVGISNNIVREAGVKFSQTVQGQGMVLAGYESLENANQRMVAFTQTLDETFTTGLTDKKQIDAAKNRVDNLANLQDQFTRTVSEITTEAMAQQRNITNMLFKPTQAFADGVLYVTEKLTKLGNWVEQFVDSLGDFSKYKELPRRERLPSTESIRREAERIPPQPPGRALGGPINANQTYLVGERGPELLVSRDLGSIINNTALNQIASLSPKDENYKLLAEKIEHMISTMNDRSFQQDMRQLMREQVILLKTHIDISREIGGTMGSLENLQNRYVMSSM